MHWITEPRARWLGGAFLFATLAALVVLSSRAPGASAADANAEGDAAMVCEATNSNPVDTNAEIADVMQEARIRLQQEAAADGETIVLNNRGYNYGPAHTVRFDSFLVERPRPYAE